MSFVQVELALIEEVVEVLDSEGHKDGTYLARLKDFDLFFEAALQAKKDLGIVNTATAVRKMAEMTLERMAEDMEDGEKG